MYRCGPRFLSVIVIALIAALTGCLGKNSANPGNGAVQSVSLNPSTTLSLDVGGTQVFSASGKNANGTATLAGSIQFLVKSGSPNFPSPLSIASNGNACAGSWDPTATLCSPGTPGIAIVTAVINGVSSPPTTVYVHQHIDNIKVTQAAAIAPQFDCFSQGQTWQFQGIAYSNNVDITNTVGPMTWSFSNPSVVTLSTSLTTLQPNQVQATAKSPGITQLFATVGGTTSTPLPFTTCLVRYIRLQIGGQGQAGNTISVNTGSGVTVTATVVDSLDHVISSPPLTWSTTNPDVAAFTTITSSADSNSASTRNNVGGATLFASCTPPSCNIGIVPALPIYASDGTLPNGQQGFGAISVDVTSTATPPTYVAWAATTGCDNQPGCTSALFSIIPAASPIGTIVSVPRTPNSMMFNHQSASRLYLGSDQGLMFIDVTSSTASVSEVSGVSTPCNVALCGKVLTISNDGKLVVISDTISTPSQVYIYNAGATNSGPVDLIIPGETATAAAFSPDQLKLFILTNTGKMYIYSTVDALTSVPIATTASDVAFSADGSFAYVAGSPASAISAYSTCSLPTNPSVDLGSVATSSTPLKIFPSPAVTASPQGLTQPVLALEPPNVDLFSAQFTQVPALLLAPNTPVQTTCNPPNLISFTAGPSYNLGQGNFVPIEAQLVKDGAEMVIVGSKLPAVLMFNVANGTTTSIPLVGNPDPLSASVSTDGSQVYVAACDQYVPNTTPAKCASGSVHIVNTISQGDLQQVPFVNINENNNPNMCSGLGGSAPLCVPDLIAVKPQ